MPPFEHSAAATAMLKCDRVGGWCGADCAARMVLRGKVLEVDINEAKCGAVLLLLLVRLPGGKGVESHAECGCRFFGAKVSSF
jgi:hypothetical protein